MRIIDTHLHATGQETVGEVLRTMDAAGVEQACILAPFLNEPYSLLDAESLRAANEHVAALVRGHGDRLIGFAVVNPALVGAADEVERAATDLGLRGLKLVPSGWYPYDEVARAVYARAEAWRLPVLFHSGIYIDGRSSRFCRPAYCEALRDYPALRVTLAHLGWPWSDEAIAVALIDRIRGRAPSECQFRLDLSFGPPPAYRQEVVARAWRTLGAELLLYGSDRFLPCQPDDLRRAHDEAKLLLDRLGVAEEEARRIFADNALAWLEVPQRAGAKRRADTGPPRGTDLAAAT